MQSQSSQSQCITQDQLLDDLIQKEYTAMRSKGQRLVMSTVFEEAELDLFLAKTAMPDIEMAVKMPRGI